MRELTKVEIAILQRHANWIQSNGKDGERADLHGRPTCAVPTCAVPTWTFLAGRFGAGAKTSKLMTDLWHN